MKQELKSPSNDRELEKFFQSWIFFGLLHEILNPYDLFSINDYVMRDAHGEYVNTMNLLARLNAWQKAVECLPDADKAELSEQLDRCLCLAAKTMECLYSMPSAPLTAKLGHICFNRAIALSLATLCETLCDAVSVGLSLPGRTFEWRCIGWNDEILRQMTWNGWCLHEVAVLRGEFITFSAHEFLRSMIKPSLGLDHTRCNADFCLQLQTNESYKPKHTTVHCSCENLGPVGPPLDTVIEYVTAENTIPVLRILGRSADVLNIEVLPHTSGDASAPYVALSHLWADGLGSQDELALPRCKVLRLASIIRNLNGLIPWGRDHPEDRELFLWCDSLLCPIEPKQNATVDQKRSKANALDKMRDVYTNAAYVLVLDASIECYFVTQKLACLRQLCACSPLGGCDEFGLSRKLSWQRTSSYNLAIEPWTYVSSGSTAEGCI